MLNIHIIQLWKVLILIIIFWLSYQIICFLLFETIIHVVFKMLWNQTKLTSVEVFWILLALLLSSIHLLTNEIYIFIIVINIVVFNFFRNLSHFDGGMLFIRPKIRFIIVQMTCISAFLNRWVLLLSFLISISILIFT